VGECDADVGGSFGGVSGEKCRGFDGDVVGARAEAGEGGGGGEYGVDGVAAGVGEGGFGVFATGEKMVAVGVEGLAAGAKLVVEVGWEDREAEFALKEGAEVVVVETVVGIVAWEAVEGEACEGAEEGWEGDADVVGGVGEKFVELETFEGSVEFAGEALEGKCFEGGSEGGEVVVGDEGLWGVVGEETEELALRAGVGPRGEGTRVAGEEFEGCAIDLDAMLCVLDGAAEGDDEIWDGGDGVVAVANAAHGCGVVGNGDGVVGEFVGVAGEPAKKGVGAIVDGRKVWGGPGLFGVGGIIDSGEVVDVGGKDVGDCGLGTGAEESALCLSVGEAVGEFVEGGGVGGDRLGEVLLSEGLVAEGEAEEADACGDFGGGGAVGDKKIESFLEVLGLVGG
jgi:hypothetical protein